MLDPRACHGHGGRRDARDRAKLPRQRQLHDQWRRCGGHCHSAQHHDHHRQSRPVGDRLDPDRQCDWRRHDQFPEFGHQRQLPRHRQLCRAQPHQSGRFDAVDHHERDNPDTCARRFGWNQRKPLFLYARRVRAWRQLDHQRRLAGAVGIADHADRGQLHQRCGKHGRFRPGDPGRCGDRHQCRIADQCQRGQRLCRNGRATGPAWRQNQRRRKRGAGRGRSGDDQLLARRPVRHPGNDGHDRRQRRIQQRNDHRGGEHWRCRHPPRLFGRGAQECGDDDADRQWQQPWLQHRRSGQCGRQYGRPVSRL